MDYNHKEIEAKWQKHWKENKTFETKKKGKNFFVLDMFPYPSGDGLHVGHPRGYVGSDVISHYMRMNGFNVMHPMGWDAFGLPAENYAIKTGVNPRITTAKNVERFRQQMDLIGLSYDWSKEVNTTDPEYYKWTQWIFLKLFHRGLAHIKESPINWCPSCKTGLANEEVVAGKCERCGTEVTKKNIAQWVLKITSYADRLLDGLEKLDWPEKIKEMQRNWIGKSVGADINFKANNEIIKVFTTRPDTIFGVTFMVLAPEHELVSKLTTDDKKQEVERYIEQTKNKSDIERQTKSKTGVFIGSYAINPANNKEIPIYIADYVLPHYGYGAIMAVPAHDERDYEFANQHGLEIIQVIKNEKAINSGELNGKTIPDFIEYLENNKIGKKTINYKLRDWIFSRQRYWGEPIPLVFCEACKEKIESGNTKGFSRGEIENPGWIADENLPVQLPELEDFKPTDDGNPPLAKAEDWINTACPKCGGLGKREVNTMPQWAGSCWYFLRYLDNKNDKEIASKKIIKQWLPVDYYIGGAEHAVLHLLYSRFWTMVLHDEKVLHFDEPFTKLRTIGLILAEKGEKMSKSKGNVVNPDDVIEQYGADTFRVYEMFMGPFDQPIAWDTKGIVGVRRFIEKAWNLQDKIIDRDSQELIVKLHQTIKKVTEDIEAQKFNTAVAAMMEFVNLAEKGITKQSLEIFAKILYPFAPHMCSELTQNLIWPKYKTFKQEKINIIIQVNGKLRATLNIEKGLSEDKIKQLAEQQVSKYLEKGIKKTIFIQDKLINFVI